MRELKFRAFGGVGTDTKEMFVPTLGEFNDINDEIENLQDDGIVFMQYTGLKDKNGLEIYEGDVVTHEDFKEASVVTFERGCFRIHGFTIANFEAIHHMVKIEVIGNIYENSQLLED